MKFTYPAVIGKEENGSWKAVLPDLACCEAEAETLEEVIEKANAALYDWIDFGSKRSGTASEGGAAGQTDLRKYPFV